LAQATSNTNVTAPKSSWSAAFVSRVRKLFRNGSALALSRPSAQHADDGVRPAVDAHRLADDTPVAPKARLPEPVAQYGHLIPADRAVLVQEVAAERKPMAATHHGQQPRRRDPCLDALGPVTAREVHAPQAPGVQVLEDGGPTSPFGEIAGIGEQPVAADEREDRHQPLRLVVRERRQKDGVDDAEDRDVGRGPEGQRQDGDGRERGVLPEETEAKPCVPQEIGRGVVPPLV
jgi:hypothetical protein